MATLRETRAGKRQTHRTLSDSPFLYTHADGESVTLGIDYKPLDGDRTLRRQRLRLTIGEAESLRQMLGESIDDAAKPQGQEK
jgi:hypothetical protein